MSQQKPDMLNSIIGFAMFGVAARMGHLGIQKTTIFHRPILHGVTGAVFGFAGYWIWRWDTRVIELLAIKRAEIKERREKHLAVVEAMAASKLAGTDSQNLQH